MFKNILTVKNLSKRFHSVKALDNISFSIKKGEVHAICGENGAGKSTFIKLLTGALEPTSGEIMYEGNTYTKLSPKEAMRLGISVIYQEFSLIPDLSVSENIFYGREIQKFGFCDIKKMNTETKKLFKEMGVNINEKVKVRDLGIAYQQIIEILKAVSQDSKFIIMDEPTAPLTINETKIFFEIINKLKEKNTTIVFITHRLDEIFEICDRVTVFMDGKYITSKPVPEINKKQLISYMVGRELVNIYPKPQKSVGDVIFKADNLYNSNIKSASFVLRKGEILGFGGLVGAGRTELARVLFGADTKNGGEMFYKDKIYTPRSPKNALKAGIGLIPEDRKNDGIIANLTVANNIIYSSLIDISTCSIIHKKLAEEKVDQYVNLLNIKTSSTNEILYNLSGGNQQKVVLAKMLSKNCDILIFDEPTRGIDVGAKQEIYSLMCALVDSGKSIILISSEMEELIGMSTRIIVMSNGFICAELKQKDFSQQKILELASSKLGEKNE